MTIKAIEKALGKKITKCNVLLNGKQAYRMEGSFCLFTKSDLLVKVYCDL